jgi:hypothetical protein
MRGKMIGLAKVLALVVAGIAGVARAAELTSDTIAAWDTYVRNTEVAMRPRLNGGRAFLWTDEAEDRKRRVRVGNIVVAPALEDGIQAVPGGIIHHWIGAIFVSNATARTLLAVLDDHENYKSIYKPAVVDSRSLGGDGEEQEFSMVWVRHVLFVHAAMLGHYRSHDFVVDERRGYSVADATRIQEIENYRKPGERCLPPGNGAGFIWRIHSISRYEERDGGVYLEVEALALSRDIPPSVRWMVMPTVNHLSIDSLKATLGQTRQAVQTRAAMMGPLAMRGR